MRALPIAFLGLVACAPRVEVTLLSLAGTNDPTISRIDFVLTAGDRTGTVSTQEVDFPRIETLILPESFEGQLLHIEATAFIGETEIGHSAADIATNQHEATLLFALCSNGATEDPEQCDDGNLTDGDGCDSTCKPTGCNSGVFTPGEICFSPQGAVIANAPPTNVIVEDMNGDQLLDLVALYPDGKARIFFGNEANLFGDFVELDFNLSLTASRLAVADLNQDGFLDLMGGDSATSATFLNQGDETFKAGQRNLVESDLRGLVLADLDGDLIPEKVELDFVQSQVVSRKGLADGTFDVLNAPSRVSVGTQPIALAVADIDQDGDNDIVTANASGSVSVVLNNAGTLTANIPFSANGTPIALTTGDFNADGLLDVAVTKQAGAGLATLFKQINPASFSELGTFEAPNTPNGLVTTDVDLDGDVDVAVTSGSNSTVTILVNNGLGQFAAGEAPIITTANPKAIATGDINRDGIPDFVTVGQDIGLIFSTP